MEIKGTIEAIFETKQFKSGFKKREFVINTGGDYPQSIKMEVLKDNIDKVGSMSVGTPVECKIDIRGRLYEGNYYNNILAWSIKEEGHTAAKSDQPEAVAEDDGLPF